MEDAYIVKVDEYCFAITCYESSDEMFHLMGFNGIVMEGEQPKLSSHIDMRLSNLIQMCWDKSSKTTSIFGNLYPIIRYC
jgi:hypothetical protein